MEKLASAAGGATNHRLALYDAVLIKNNHITAAGHGGGQLLDLVPLILVELVGGAAVGLVVGLVGARLMRHLSSSLSGLFPIGVVSWTLLAYDLASLAHTSGFIAVYLSALVLGNVPLPHRTTTRGFAQALGWLAQIGMFVMLGLLASPSELAPQVAPAIGLGPQARP